MKSQLTILLNKMGCLRERIALSLTWQEQCLMSTRLRTIVGLKQSTPLAMRLTTSISTSTKRRLHMSC